MLSLFLFIYLLLLLFFFFEKFFKLIFKGSFSTLLNLLSWLFGALDYGHVMVNNGYHWFMSYMTWFHMGTYIFMDVFMRIQHFSPNMSVNFALNASYELKFILIWGLWRSKCLIVNLWLISLVYITHFSKLMISIFSWFLEKGLILKILH